MTLSRTDDLRDLGAISRIDCIERRRARRAGVEIDLLMLLIGLLGASAALHTPARASDVEKVVWELL